jgi:hypothetical protein
MDTSLILRIRQPFVWFLATVISLGCGFRVDAQSSNSLPGITALYSNTFFRVTGTPPRYLGARACSECHQTLLTTEMDTRHAQAFQTLKQIGQATNSSCLPCHTVGYGLPSGFVSESATPQLEGVQCESCHGPAANHQATPYSPRRKPLVEAAGKICGGCHTGAQHPIYEEWSASAHAEVVEDLSPSSRVSACGRCHSGSVRVSLLDKRSLPVGQTNINVPVGCVLCHDPHARHVWTNALGGVAYTNQLRNPLSSTNDYFLSMTDTFAKKYNTNINVCAQCHNSRGDSSQNSSCPPHGSPQYNMLLGTVGELASGVSHYQPAAHALLITNQCVGCHMQIPASSGKNQPVVTGHAFTVQTFQLCLQCHPFPNLLVQFTQGAVSNQVQELKFALDFWATTRAPAALRTKYGALAWEYTTPGSLSSGSKGPNATEQKQIPLSIQKARFNLYLVWNEGSLGVHNGPYTTSLLDAAENWVLDELDN